MAPAAPQGSGRFRSSLGLVLGCQADRDRDFSSTSVHRASPGSFAVMSAAPVGLASEGVCSGAPVGLRELRWFDPKKSQGGAPEAPAHQPHLCQNRIRGLKKSLCDRFSPSVTVKGLIAVLFPKLNYRPRREDSLPELLCCPGGTARRVLPGAVCCSAVWEPPQPAQAPRLHRQPPVSCRDHSDPGLFF